MNILSPIWWWVNYISYRECQNEPKYIRIVWHFNNINLATIALLSILYLSKVYQNNDMITFAFWLFVLNISVIAIISVMIWAKLIKSCNNQTKIMKPIKV